MKGIYWAGPSPREGRLAHALATGAKRIGLSIEVRATSDFVGQPLGDFALYWGVKRPGRHILDTYRKAGKACVHCDKGYMSRSSEWLRLSVNDVHPGYLDRERDSSRWNAIGIELQPQRPFGRHIVLAGSSPKYCEFAGLGDATEYHASLVQRIRRLTSRPIVYRPKPSWKDAIPIAGAAFSHGATTLEQDLNGAHALVTHGSISSLDALILGYPVIALGSAPVRAVAECDLEKIDNPSMPSNDRRLAICHALAWCQWRLDEISSGKALDDIRELLAS